MDPIIIVLCIVFFFILIGIIFTLMDESKEGEKKVCIEGQIPDGNGGCKDEDKEDEKEEEEEKKVCLQGQIPDGNGGCKCEDSTLIMKDSKCIPAEVNNLPPCNGPNDPRHPNGCIPSQTLSSIDSGDSDDEEEKKKEAEAEEAERKAEMLRIAEHKRKEAERLRRIAEDNKRKLKEAQEKLLNSDSFNLNQNTSWWNWGGNTIKKDSDGSDDSDDEEEKKKAQEKASANERDIKNKQAAEAKEKARLEEEKRQAAAAAAEEETYDECVQRTRHLGKCKHLQSNEPSSWQQFTDYFTYDVEFKG